MQLSRLDLGQFDYHVGNRNYLATKEQTLGKPTEERFDDALAVEEERPQLAKPPLFKVFLVNDDFTPMEFVVSVLQRFFTMSKEKATQIMLQVHYRGRGVCGVFTFDIAETKVNLVNEFARESQHPLMCSMEEI